ncbi:MAG: hypothetical protein M1824_005097 [Vezdaea acicularis]|nr:MAG: hypothetical protein M1824_005097 [Vezdaea acicularis]
MLRAKLLSQLLTQNLSPSISNILIFSPSGTLYSSSVPAPPSPRMLTTLLANIYGSYSTRRAPASISFELTNSIIHVQTISPSLLLVLVSRPDDHAITNGERPQSSATSSVEPPTMTESGEVKSAERPSRESTVSAAAKRNDGEELLGLLKAKAENLARFLKKELEGFEIKDR